MKLLVFDRESVEDGGIKTVYVTIDNSGSCDAAVMSATLVWTDPPAYPSCQMCVLNDLDLVVKKDKGEGKHELFHPNGRTSRDDINNSERVMVEVADGDEFTVSVKAHDLTTEMQKYALVVTGCVKVSEDNDNTDKISVSPTPASSTNHATASPTPASSTNQTTA